MIDEVLYFVLEFANNSKVSCLRVQPKEWKMKHNHGFSITEVMVSLLLLSTTTLALINQQWHAQQLINKTQGRIRATNVLYNTAELSLAAQKSTSIPYIVATHDD